jgi:heavy metal translocating P-type ATPase
VVFRVALGPQALAARVPLLATLVIGGTPLVLELAWKALKREFGSDLLAGISIVTSVVLGEHLAGALVVLMLSGGTALERYAVGRASSVLGALARRMPAVGHVRRGGAADAPPADVPLADIAVGDLVVIFPHEVSPVDGVVVEGQSVMDESYLTGEPFERMKTPGAEVISGAVNGDGALTVRATRRAVDSRYAKIMQVMRETEENRPRIRRLADRLGAAYTPLAVAIALVAFAASGDPRRFLAVLVIATPCPLLIAIPVAIIGAISLAAKRSIIIRDPSVLEQVDDCRTIILDKTGTLTYGKPTLTDEVLASGSAREVVLALVASLEQYSKHPLAVAILEAARAAGVALAPATEIAEHPGEGLAGHVAGRKVEVTGRANLARRGALPPDLPAQAAGLECVILVDGAFAAVYRFRDTPRAGSRSFIEHLGPRHRVDRVLLVSGDRASEVRWLAERVGIHEVHAEQRPEDKVAIVRRETARAKTVFMGDGINDAPALLAATVGVAFGPMSDVTTEAAGAVVMDASLERADELFHIGRRMRRIALQSAVGGMALSVAGMLLAATGLLSPVAGAIGQELIDLAAVLNALRVAAAPRGLTDYDGAAMT